MLVSFQGQDKAVTRGARFCAKKYDRPGGVWRFFGQTRKGMTLKPKKGAAIPSPLRNGISVRPAATDKVEGMSSRKNDGKPAQAFS
jgi:hypothetical protein